MVPPLLGAGEELPFSVINPDGKAKCLLLCEHASNVIPKKLNNLGLSKDDTQSHIAWDIGAAYVTKLLSDILDAPTLLANYSRLVVDANRPLDHPTAIITNSEGMPIPGNMAIAQEDRDLRISEIYAPYHEKIRDLIGRFTGNHIIPVIVSIHSFAPVFYKQVRPWDIGVLWVQDPRIPLPVINFFEKRGFTVGDNEPYDARIFRGTVINHYADAHGLPNALIEICHDLIDTEEKGQEWAVMLGECFKTILQDETVYSRYDGLQAAHDTEREYRYFDELIEKAKRGE